MSTESTSSSMKCKTFVSEAEIEESKKKRQEEWDKVRKPDDPVEAPEEEYDSRCLYDRLQEQKDKRQADYEETHKLKNLIKGLDDDEVAFLELVDKTKMEMETKLLQEELKEIQEYKQAVAHLSEAESSSRLKELRKTVNQQNHSPSKKSQQTLLAGAVKRKASEPTASQEKKRCISSGTDSAQACNSSENEAANDKEAKTDSLSKPATIERVQKIGTLRCLGVLPGLGAYSDSSDSENSSNSETEKDNDFDIIGRRRIIVQQVQNHS